MASPSEFKFSLLLGRLFNRVGLIKPVSNVRPFLRAYVPTYMRTFTSVRTCVHPSVRKKFFSILMKFGVWVAVDEWCTTVCSMTRSKVKVKVTSSSKLEIRPFSAA